MAACEPADAERGAEVVEHHRRVGACLRHGEELLVLVVVVPRVVGEPPLPQSSHTRSKRRVFEQPLRRTARDAECGGLHRPRQRMADPSKSPTTCVDVGVEQFVEL